MTTTKINTLFLYLLFIQVPLVAQVSIDSISSAGHSNTNKFKQLKEELSTPNSYRTASGAPGRDYYQQKVDYIMDIELDDENKKIYGEEEITYTNNSPDELSYLWIQLDQNIRKKDAPALEKMVKVLSPFFAWKHLSIHFLKNLLMEDLILIG